MESVARLPGNHRHSCQGNTLARVTLTPWPRPRSPHPRRRAREASRALDRGMSLAAPAGRPRRASIAGCEGGPGARRLRCCALRLCLPG
ncbi:hypothetical protein E2C01_044673 [Portunus trituberculatus]|uniref:Uncharacterized protein n=1 Tax=Portunus trituberculatus TaxID=210409 RepID=A0A5B7FZZ1_PORTR|nr:hypothetical protein [Portunus trituberculatus]